MRLECPQCKREVPSADVNIQSAIAKCARCSVVFSVAQALGVAAGPDVWNKRPVDMPKSISVGSEGPDLLITHRWVSPKYIFMSFFCLFWDGYLVELYYSIFIKGGPLVMKFLLPLYAVAAVGLTYFVVAGLINRTLIRVGFNGLSVRHGPLPWPGNRVVPREEMEQLFCQEKVNHSKNGVFYTYQVTVARPGGARITLVTLDSPEQALFIEQKVEGFLGIRDRPIAGEIRPI